MRAILFLSIFICGFAYAGDNVDESSEVIGVHPGGSFLVLEKWTVMGEETSGPFPMFFMTFRSFGQLEQFAEIPTLAGLPRSEMDDAYPRIAAKKWDEILPNLRKAGYKNEGIELLKVQTDNKGYSTVHLPDGRIITERGKALKRKPNDLQREDISLWISAKAGEKPTLLKDKAMQTVVRSFSHAQIQRAYWLKELKTVVALYNNPSQGAEDRAEDIWTHRFD